MRDYVIMADVNTDVPRGYAKENGISILPQYYHFNDGTIYGDELLLTPEEFYGRLKNERAYSMGCNPERVREIMEEALKNDKDILVLMASSECSGSYNTVRLEAEELMAEYSGSVIRVIDTLLEAAPCNLMLHKAVDMKAAGKPLEEVFETLEKEKNEFNIFFLVDHLDYLVRGGRLNALSGAVGTMLQIKPILHFEEGKIVPWQKARGKQAGKKMIVEALKKMNLDPHYFCVAHTLCEKDAEEFGQLLEKELPGVKVLFSEHVSLIIGTHVGPDALAVAFRRLPD